MNFRHPWYSVVFALEQKFGRLAIPMLIRYIALIQFSVFLIDYYQQGAYAEMLVFDKDLILQGQVWRLFTFILIPGYGLFWAIFALFFMWMISDGLESALGSFQVNLFVLASFVPLVTCMWFFPHEGSANFLFFSCLLFAFSTYYPDQIIRLFLVIPIKIKYIAFLNLAIVLMIAMGGWSSLITVTAAMLPYLLVFGPRLVFEVRHRQKTAERRSRFKAQQIPESDVFHRCASCGVTDQKDPEMDFRVTAEGEEYCVECLAQTQKN